MIQSEQRRGVAAWSTRELLTAAVLGIVFGVVLIPLNYIYLPLIALGPIVQWACTGPWHFPSFFATYALRRPGAGLLIGLLYSLILIPFTPFGVLYLLAGLVYGGTSELGMALTTRYRHFGWLRLVVGGMIANTLNFVISGALFQQLNFALPIIVGAFAASALSAAACAMLARVAADTIARTGVLSGTALGYTADEV
jgi:energy-coupling factor transport system permease protein